LIILASRSDAATKPERGNESNFALDYFALRELEDMPTVRIRGIAAEETQMKRTSSTPNHKLTSLLALSAGALAAPTVADAAIIYSGVINQKVGFSTGFGDDYAIFLPGTARLLLDRQAFGSGYYGTWRVRLAQTAGYARVKRSGLYGYFALRNNAGLTWDIMGGVPDGGPKIGERKSSYGTSHWVVGPGSFNDKYIAFMFKDSTQGNADRYGWALMSMAVTPTTGPDATLTSWAYDDTGAKIAMGDVAAVPEPSSAVLMAMGALVLGSRGVRRWRSRKHEAAGKN
jgi:hypothetical protein